MGKTERSDPNFYRSYKNYDSNGHKVDHSDPGLFGRYTTNDTGTARPAGLSRISSADTPITTPRATRPATAARPAFLQLTVRTVPPDVPGGPPPRGNKGKAAFWQIYISGPATLCVKCNADTTNATLGRKALHCIN